MKVALRWFVIGLCVAAGWWMMILSIATHEGTFLTFIEGVLLVVLGVLIGVKEKPE
jgi:hypothetical protein